MLDYSRYVMLDCLMDKISGYFVAAVMLVAALGTVICFVVDSLMRVGG